MATFYLVPGAWHGAWCWLRVVPSLIDRGHKVVAVELASLGEDQTAPTEVTLAKWADEIAHAIAHEAEPVILVGHSRGGAVISEVAERVPDSVKSLVYLAAFLLPDGLSVGTMAASDPDSGKHGLIAAPDERGAIVVQADKIGPVFYNRTAPEWVRTAKELVKPEPVAGLATAVRVTPARFGSVHRVYVECAYDEAVPLSLQRRMQKHWPCNPVYTLQSDHSPFFSAPEMLVNVLAQIACRHPEGQ